MLFLQKEKSTKHLSFDFHQNWYSCFPPYWIKNGVTIPMTQTQEKKEENTSSLIVTKLDAHAVSHNGYLEKVQSIRTS
jgi:hypothetical protein